MGVYKHLRKLWQQPDSELKTLWKERLMTFRRELATTRITHPTRLDRARALGYKAKPGFLIVRQRVKRGGHKRESYLGGKRSKRQTHRLNLAMNYQRICEERANKKYKNCEVLGSYFVTKDGKHIWYEIILVDRTHPAVLKDPRFSWLKLAANKGRVFRGLTSAGRKSRGLRNKGKGAEKVR